MRPLKLTIQAFGAYLNKVEIPFSNLGQSNIFLISGNTGSGKTTIFDAVCFALFNSSSGSLRGNSTLRSHYASDNIKSFVEFEFFFRGENYKIIRTPQYQRKKLKGEGFIKENATAEIYLPDGKIIYGVSEVDKYVIELLGVNLAQFSQIALLAQGEFIKLLNSSTNERSEIFRNIFNTDSFLIFQNKLKDEFIKYKNLNQDIKKSITQYILQIRSEDSELLELIQFFKENELFLQLDKLIEKLNNANKENDKKIKVFQKKLNDLTKQNKEKYTLHQRILAKNRLLKNKLHLTNEISQQKEVFEAARKEFLTLDDKNKEIQSLRLETNELEQDVIKAQKILQYQKDFLKSSEQLKSLTNENVTLNQNIENLKIEFLRYKYFELEELNKNLSAKQNKLNDLKEIYNAENALYNQKYEIYLSSQAGILAQTLKDNVPCPVCGAKKHPKPAEISDEKISKEFLDECKDELNLKQQVLNDVSLNCSVLIEKIKSKKDEIFKFASDINYTDKIELTDEVIKIDFENKIKNEYSQIEKLSGQISEIKLFCASLGAQIDTLKSQLREVDVEKIMKNYEDLNFKLANLIKIESEISKNYEQQNLKLTSLISNNELTDKQLEEVNDVDVAQIEVVEVELDEIEEKIENINTEIKNLSLIKGINDDVYQNLFKKSNEFIEIQKYYDSLKLLNDCANGNLKGKRRITYEQYIQGYYLDLVLNEANKILKILTKNQFQFLRSEDVSSGQSKTGLDIEIMDFYTYKTRSSKTLSGGESFMAALSLAFGLSTTVSNMSGAKNIDTLFIDEGFGSLDCESLDTAINKIIDLCSSNRIIGIISHVEELKNNIQNQIKTTKTQSGSSVQITF